MSFLDGVLAKQDPAERLKHALMRDLELRRSAAISSGQFSGYAYQGSADLLIQSGIFLGGRPLPEEYAELRGAGNECYWNALDAALTRPELRFCEGVYMVASYSCSHAWCIAPDGGVLELTFPTDPATLEIARHPRTGLPYLPPRHWGYYGLTFDAHLVAAHAEQYGLPMLDRTTGERVASDAEGGDPNWTGLTRSREDLYAERWCEQHDYPILKHPYNPNRTELP